MLGIQNNFFCVNTTFRSKQLCEGEYDMKFDNKIDTKFDNLNWWKGVEHVVGLLSDGKFERIEEAAMAEHLRQLGFARSVIDEVFSWIEMVSCSGSFAEILTLTQRPRMAMRVNDPLEELCVPREILHKIENLRRRGFISLDMSERLLEGVRCADARDWDTDEIHAFMKDMTSAALEESHQTLLSGVMANKNPQKILC